MQSGLPFCETCLTPQSRFGSLGGRRRGGSGFAICPDGRGENGGITEQDPHILDLLCYSGKRRINKQSGGLFIGSKRSSLDRAGGNAQCEKRCHISVRSPYQYCDVLPLKKQLLQFGIVIVCPLLKIVK